MPQLNLDQSIPTLSCLDHSIPPLNCLDHSIPFRSRYTVGTVWVLDQSYSVQNCLDLGIRNFLDQNPHPFLDLSHRDRKSNLLEALKKQPLPTETYYIVKNSLVKPTSSDQEMPDKEAL